MTTAPVTRHRWTHRLVAVALMLAAILVAGVIGRAAHDIAEADARLYADVEQDQVIRVGEYATMRITGITVGSSLTQRDSLVATTGRYVVVEFEVTAGRRQAPTVRAELHAAGNVYREVDNAYERLAPGYAGNRASLFEVPTAMLDGPIAIVFGEVELVYSHQHWVRWRPRLDDEIVSSSEHLTVSLPTATVWVAP